MVKWYHSSFPRNSCEFDSRYPLQYTFSNCFFDFNSFIMSKMNKLFKITVSVVGCELVGLLGTPFTVSSIPTWYAQLNKPLFAPPNWIFGPVWTLLYFLMGVSVFLIWKKVTLKKQDKVAIKYFLAQLFVNFLWSPFFFGLKSPALGLITIVTMWVLIVITVKRFYRIVPLAAYLLIPYLLWVSFATLLNASILVLN